MDRSTRIGTPLTRIVLAGGGGAAESRLLDQTFAGWVGAGHLLYLPLALDRERHADASDWLRSVFGPLGTRRITTWSCLDLGRLAQRLDDFDGVYVGGGNTYRLARHLRRSGLDAALVSYVHAGGPIYGGSAGAIVLGKDIATALLAGDTNELGLVDTRGLDLLGGWSVACHFETSATARTQAFARKHDSRILGLPERAGVVIVGSDARVIGEQVTALDGRRVLRFAPDESVGIELDRA